LGRVAAGQGIDVLLLAAGAGQDAGGATVSKRILPVGQAGGLPDRAWNVNAPFASTRVRRRRISRPPPGHEKASFSPVISEAFDRSNGIYRVLIDIAIGRVHHTPQTGCTLC
jgi:hypothetical protein